MRKEDLLDQIAQLPDGIPVLVQIGDEYHQIDKADRASYIGLIKLETPTIGTIPDTASAEEIEAQLDAQQVTDAKGRTVTHLAVQENLVVTVFADGTWMMLEAEVDDCEDGAVISHTRFRSLARTLAPFELKNIGLITAAHVATLEAAALERKLARLKQQQERLAAESTRLAAQMEAIA